MTYILGNGYLANKFKHQKIVKNIDEIGNDVTEIWHFASPNSSENPERLIDSIKLTYNLIKKFPDIKIVFASSEAVNVDKDLYSNVKKTIESLLIENHKNYKIFRIPRVYSADRNSGLIKTLKDGEFVGDMNKTIKFITDDEFCLWFMENINKENTIIEYPTSEQISLKIKDIKSIFKI